MHQVHAKDGGRPGKGDFCLLFSPACLDNPGIKQRCTGLARAETSQDEGAVDTLLAGWGQGSNTWFLRAIGEGTCLCLFLQVFHTDNFIGTKSILKSLFMKSLGWGLACHGSVILSSPFLSPLG